MFNIPEEFEVLILYTPLDKTKLHNKTDIYRFNVSI